MNQVTLVGNLGNDPEVRYTGKGDPVCNMRIATNEFWKNSNGEKQEHTEWHRIVVWGKNAENCGKYLKKGRLVSITGKLRTREWEDREGNKRRTTEIVANNVQFLSSPSSQVQVKTEREVDEAQVPVASVDMDKDAQQAFSVSTSVDDNVPF